MAPRSSFATGAITLLAIAAIGGLSVGVPLVLTQLTSQLGSGSLVPAVALAYGAVSLAGLVGIVLRWKWAVPLVVVSQVVCALLDARVRRT